MLRGILKIGSGDATKPKEDLPKGIKIVKIASGDNVNKPKKNTSKIVKVLSGGVITKQNEEDTSSDEETIHLICNDEEIHIKERELKKIKFGCMIDKLKDDVISEDYIKVDVDSRYINLCKKYVRKGLVISKELIEELKTTIELCRDKQYKSKYINGEIYRKIIKYCIKENYT